MKIEWDKEYEVFRGNSIYKEELDEIGRFLKSKHKNVCFTYETEKLAYNAYTRLYKIAKTDKIPVIFKRQKEKLYVFKEDAK